MDQATIASSTADFIDQVQTFVGANLGLVLAFAAGIMVWGILKKWVFGGTSRI